MDVNDGFYNMDVEGDINLDFFNTQNLGITIHNQPSYNPRNLEDFFSKD
jgi:hypothetical protein